MVEGKTRVIYVKLVKAIYGCVKSALLWYELFTKSLKSMGFRLNPYDPCTANCEIEGTQCTVAWYVDVVTSIIEKFEQQFGKMTVTRGTEHVFLGMNIRYTENRTAVITMKEYLKESIEESELNISYQGSGHTFHERSVRSERERHQVSGPQS